MELNFVVQDAGNILHMLEVLDHCSVKLQVRRLEGYLQTIVGSPASLVDVALNWSLSARYEYLPFDRYVWGDSLDTCSALLSPVTRQNSLYVVKTSFEGWLCLPCITHRV